ncbi:MAG: hypothetical protein HY897_13840 [Deltaproteobacteria bacterium]|nr:hypothetical protein [Deltaproteobacteria bacterium]
MRHTKGFLIQTVVCMASGVAIDACNVQFQELDSTAQGCLPDGGCDTGLGCVEGPGCIGDMGGAGDAGQVSSGCTGDQECIVAYGTSYVCGPKGACERVCSVDRECGELGRGWFCDAREVCRHSCLRDLDCILDGWHMVCDLPPGVDGDENAYSQSPVSGECIRREGGVDWGIGNDSSKPSFAWRGVWGMMLNTAVRTTGLPLINQQDTYWNQFLLVRIAQDGEGIAWDLKWCGIDLVNFREDDSTFADLSWIAIPGPYIDHIPVQKLHGAHVPALDPGASFRTDRLLEIRGARLSNPETGDLPNYDDLDGQWDQDNDRNPGMTTFMAGVVTAEIYNAMRWTCILNPVVVDTDHVHGLVEHTLEQNILGASTPAYVFDTVSVMHPQADRSYFEMMRMTEAASCTELIVEKDRQGSWIEFAANKALGHFDPAAKP